MSTNANNEKAILINKDQSSFINTDKALLISIDKSLLINTDKLQFINFCCHYSHYVGYCIMNAQTDKDTMSSFPSISAIEKEIYGEFYWSNPPPTEQELRESERNEHGLIAFLFLPIYDPSLRWAFTIPTKWFDTDNYMYFPPLHEILEIHYKTIIEQMRTKKAKKSYKNPKHYSLLINYIQKWKLNQHLAADTTSVQNLQRIDNTITSTFSTGQLVLLNGRKLSFAKNHPIAQVKRTNERKSELEVILMHKTDDDTIQPLPNSTTYIVNVSEVCRVLSNQSNQVAMQLAYFKLKCKNFFFLGYCTLH
eukprot:315840_1